MISVVICSVNKALAAQVKRNIDKTIGVPWELVLLDNSVLKKSITEIYNIGAARSNFDVICFVHEDVLFRSTNWGKTIVAYFDADPLLGLVGVAGSRYKSKTPSGWSTGIPALDCCNILHINKKGHEQRIYSNPEPGKIFQQVVTLDGVFLCCRKTVWEQVRFDEKMLTGFHLYDIDFSYRVSEAYRVAVTYEVDMIHLTEGGDFGNQWLEYTLKWHEKYRALLPRKMADLPLHNDVELKIRKNWLHRLKTERISTTNKWKWLKETESFYNPVLWPYIAVFLLNPFNR